MATESSAAIAFYSGLIAFVFGAVRVVTVSVERGRRGDRVGVAAIAVGAVLLLAAVVIFLRSAKGVLPF